MIPAEAYEFIPCQLSNPLEFLLQLANVNVPSQIVANAARRSKACTIRIAHSCAIKRNEDDRS